MYYWQMQPEEAYSKFLGMMEKAVETNSASSASATKDRIFQHEIFVKFAYHIASILTLEHGSRFSSSPSDKMSYDYSSVIVLFRAALETYLTYYYIYRDASDADERMLRFHNWMIDGLNMRQKADVSFSADLQLKKALEAADIYNSIRIIQGTDAYYRLSEGKQHAIIGKRKWYRPGWADIFAKTGFAEYWARMFYSIFSAYAHTSSQSIMQFKDATVRNEGKQLTTSFARLILTVCALFTESYREDFALGSVFDEQETEMLEAWIWFSKNLPTPKAGQ
jgi:hypothetical protein